MYSTGQGHGTHLGERLAVHNFRCGEVDRPTERCVVGAVFRRIEDLGKAKVANFRFVGVVQKDVVPTQERKIKTLHSGANVFFDYLPLQVYGRHGEKRERF